MTIADRLGVIAGALPDGAPVTLPAADIRAWLAEALGGGSRALSGRPFSLRASPHHEDVLLSRELIAVVNQWEAVAQRPHCASVKGKVYGKAGCNIADAKGLRRRSGLPNQWTAYP